MLGCAGRGAAGRWDERTWGSLQGGCSKPHMSRGAGIQHALKAVGVVVAAGEAQRGARGEQARRLVQQPPHAQVVIKFPIELQVRDAGV